MYKIFASIFIIILTSCASFKSFGNIKDSQTQSKVSDFNKALANEYKIFADKAWDDYMWLDYWHFKHKASKASLGEEVVQEDMKDWTIPEEELRNLIWASVRLNSFMVVYVKDKYPERFAHAQMLFDCWVMRASKKMKPEEIEECRMDFVLEMASLENMLMPVPKILPVDSNNDHFNKDNKTKKRRAKKVVH